MIIVTRGIYMYTSWIMIRMSNSQKWRLLVKQCIPVLYCGQTLGCRWKRSTSCHTCAHRRFKWGSSRSVWMRAIYIYESYIYESHIYMRAIYMRAIYIYESYIYIWELYIYESHICESHIYKSHTYENTFKKSQVATLLTWFCAFAGAREGEAREHCEAACHRGGAGGAREGRILIKNKVKNEAGRVVM